MTAAPEIDWDDAERQRRRLDLLTLPAVVGWFAGIVLLTGKYAFWRGGAAWLAVVGYGVVLLVLLALARTLPRLQEKQAAANRAQVALRRHADPGPDVRERADRQARAMVRNRWFRWWLVFVVPLGSFAAGRWTHPATAVPGALLQVAVAAAWAVWWRHRQADALRWVQDPPGPAREAPPLTRAERWLTGRRVLLLVGVLVAVSFVVGVLAAVLAG
jgi:hypothetical protein